VTLFNFHAKTIDGENVAMMKYQTTSRVQLVVNVASGIAGVPPPPQPCSRSPQRCQSRLLTWHPTPFRFPGQLVSILLIEIVVLSSALPCAA
jgi:hypothetical protein